MYKKKKFFVILILLTWISHLGFAAPTSSPIHKQKIHSSHTHPKKKLIKPNKHKLAKKHIKTNITHHRIIKPHIVNSEIVKKAGQPPIPLPKIATSKQQSETKPNFFYRILTQPIPSMPSTTQVSNTLPHEEKMGFAASIGHQLVDFVNKTVSSLRYSSYKLGASRIDASQGIYIVDCSGYVDHTLRSIYPNAYLSLVGSSGVEKPNTSHYYNFFTNLSNDPNQFWSRIEDIEQLRAGDILVFRYKNLHGRPTGGHVMVVMNTPERDGNAYLVSVADSAASGHSDDTRQNHVSGVGIGTILLKVDPKTRRPSAYAWTFNSPWRNNVNFAMARPLEVNSWNTSLDT